MKFSVVFFLALAAVAHAEPATAAVNNPSLRGGRDLQVNPNEGGVTCITITSPDGTKRTMFPCDTEAPAPVGTNNGGDGGNTSSSSDSGD